MTQTFSDSRQRGNSVPFSSILFDGSNIGTDIDNQREPEFFGDLNLDQIVASITAGRDEYNLKPFFYTLLGNVDMIRYRQGIFLDLDGHALFEHVGTFAKQMQTMRDHLTQVEKLYYKYQKQSWFLEAAVIYCGAVGNLTRDLTRADLSSQGFLNFRDYLTSYAESEAFTALATETKKLRTNLSEVRYSLDIKGNRINVEGFSPDPDYGADVLQTFGRFKQGAVKEYRFQFFSEPAMNHVESAVLDLVARLYPDIFWSLEEFCERHCNFIDSTIRTFDREIQFYIACLNHIERHRAVGLPFCYPTVTDESKEIYGRDAFDLALANRLVSEKIPVVTNDFYLRNPERIFVISGPNQGGKTTFARMFGQLHYLAIIGCPVAGKEARLFLFDRLFTHFEKEEDIRNLSGKLEDDLVRIHWILEWATANSILIMNESFVSTTLSDALFLSKQIMQEIIQRDMLCISVTFLDELASFSESTVSLVSTVQIENPTLRTFKLVRKPADDRAYAMAIAEKYFLTYERVKERILK